MRVLTSSSTVNLNSCFNLRISKTLVTECNLGAEGYEALARWLQVREIYKMKEMISSVDRFLSCHIHGYINDSCQSIGDRVK